MFILIYILILFFNSNLISSLTSINEINILKEFYIQTNGSLWRWRDLPGVWNFNTNNIDPCGHSWQGIECTSNSIYCLSNSCNIIQINLQRYNIHGSLPINWSNLSLLTYLDLSSNKITGQLPLYFPLNIKILRLQLNRLTGSLPYEIGSLTNLQYLDLETNKIRGSIPNSIGNMISLEIFACDRNNITSTIPTSIGQLNKLKRLDLERNNITGTIPNEIFQLTNLYTLDLFHNNITGTISSFIEKLSYLTYLNLGTNYINGSIPLEINNLSSLELLQLSNNFLNSTIPSGIWMLHNLTFLDLSNNLLKDKLPNNFNLLQNIRSISLQKNQLYGSIPTSIGDIISLRKLDLSYNYFDDILPSKIGLLSNLLELEISHNLLTGTIPTSIGGLKSLTWFELQHNYIYGKIPTEIGSLIHLRYIVLPNCYLSGQLPCNSIGNLLDLTHFDTSFNNLSGKFCSEFGYLTSIENIYLAKNFFIGSISSNIGYMSSLQVFELSYNQFTNNIPLTIGNLTELAVLSLSHNEFSGLIPSQLGMLTQLEQLYLQKNHFNNNLKHIFWQVSNLHLTNIDISSNHFSGIIPKEIFLLPYIETIALTSNCFTGTLPQEICQSNYLNVLSMDGLGAEKNCKKEYLTLNSYWKYTWGNIPKCIWSMKNLTVLSLSGNGLTGTINNIPFDSKLINLTLSHNHLSGTIPLTIQTHLFNSLDLSYNKFTGETSNLITPINMSYSRIFEVNRLSGNLNSIQITKTNYQNTINILDGNIFGCYQLPKEDIQYSTYVCGSQEYDLSLTIFGGVMIFFFIILTLIIFFKFIILTFYSNIHEYSLFKIFIELFNKLHKYSSFFDSSDLHNNGHNNNDNNDNNGNGNGNGNGNNNNRSGSNNSSDSGSDIYSKTKTINELKAFSHSFRYMQTSVILVMLVGFFCCIPLYILKGLNTNNDEENNGNESDNYRTHYHLYRWMWTLAFLRGELSAGLLLFAWIISACVLMFNVNTMVNQQLKENLITNTKSIYSPSSPSLLSLPSFSILSSSIMSKNNWNNQQKNRELFMICLMVLLNIGIVGVVNGLYIYSTLQNINEVLYFWIEIAVSIFKIIWNSWMLPFMLRKYKLSRSPTLLAKLTLFNNIFIPCLAAAFTSTSCFQGVIVPSKEITSTYTYTTCYSYSGVRRIRTGEYLSWCHTYTDVTVFVEPFRPQFNYNNLCGSSILKAYIPIYLYIYTMQLIFPPISLYILARYTSYESLPKWIRPFVPAILWPLESKETIRDSISSTNSKDPMTSASMLFKRDNIAVSLMQHISLLITFGLCSPILGLAIVATTCFSITQWRILIARFVIIRTENNETTKDEVLESLNSIVGDTAICFKSMLWIVLWTSCLFFAFLCWDISADVVGWISSIWVPITAFLSLPLIWFCIICIHLLFDKEVIINGNIINERNWSKSFLFSESNAAPMSFLFRSTTNETCTNRSSEFGELNPLRITELEMIHSHLQIKNISNNNNNNNNNNTNNNNSNNNSICVNNNCNNDNESNRYTI